MAVRSNYVKRDAIPKTLLAAINDLQAGPKILNGSLSVQPGHDYWWFLEYGTGAFHQDADGAVKQPSATRQSAAGGPYEISAANAPALVYLRNDGKWRRRKDTIHPGIKPLAPVRTSIFETIHDFKAELAKILRLRLSRGKVKFPERRDLLKLMNGYLHILLFLVKGRTLNNDLNPAHQGRNPVPLEDAWYIVEAK